MNSQQNKYIPISEFTYRRNKYLKTVAGYFFTKVKIFILIELKNKSEENFIYNNEL